MGLGLNVNQMNFEHLPNASSLALICDTTFKKEEILLQIIERLKQNIRDWNQNADLITNEYTNKLFKKGIPMPFEDQNKQNFMGIIQGVSTIGKLKILLEDDSFSEFDLKEIRMLY
jgi:BirA family biotin operon repressor/biotin-[acetyl-CoA-carboxylase] ligase